MVGWRRLELNMTAGRKGETSSVIMLTVCGSSFCGLITQSQSGFLLLSVVVLHQTWPGHVLAFIFGYGHDFPSHLK